MTAPKCKRGHPLTPNNLVQQFTANDKGKTCRICRAERQHRYWEKTKMAKPPNHQKLILPAKIKPKTAGPTPLSYRHQLARDRLAELETLKTSPAKPPGTL